jgi:two-component system OmpR family sensor kinase
MTAEALPTGSLRRRVVLIALGLLMVVLVAVALVVNYFLGDRMRTDLRQRLLDRASYGQLLSDQGVSGQTLADRLAGQGITSSLTTPGGQEYIGREAPAFPGRPGPRPQVPPIHRTTAAVQENGEQLSVRLDLGDAMLTLQTSQAEIDHTLALLGRIELIAGAVTLLVVGLIMIRLVGLALAPLDRMTALAWRIRDGARGRRLRPTRPSTDLGRTAAAFDGMLDALEAAEADARSAQDRMREFLADASHDLRTPLAAIIANAEQVLRTDPDRETRERGLVGVVREARRSSRLVDDLLFMARLDSQADGPISLECRPVDLAALAGERVTALHLRRPDLRVELATGAAVPTVIADQDAITRALGNLLENAAAASTAGGLVRVAVRAENDVAVVTVTDSGHGVPAGDQERIFDRFIRVGPDASRSTSGSGLGLPIARAISRSHGGDLRCVPAAVGSCFELVLPLGGGAWTPHPHSATASVQP